MRTPQQWAAFLFVFFTLLFATSSPALASNDALPVQGPAGAARSDSSPEVPSTNVSGLITQDTTWAKANSPYIVVQSIRVVDGVTLTIEPGVEVRFAGNYFLDIGGTLVALGTASAPILFTSGDGSPASGDWGMRTATHLSGINFQDTAANAVLDAAGNYVSGSVIRHAIVEYGTGISINGAAPLIEHSIIRHNRMTGVFYNGYALVSLPASETANIRNNWITDTDGVGFNLQQGRVAFTENLVTRNPWAYLGGVEGSIQGNTIACNPGRSGQTANPASFLVVSFSNTAEFHNNNFMNNGQQDVALRFDGRNLDLSQNYWGTTDLAAIRDRIFDQSDDLDIPGVVTIEPILTSAVPIAIFDPTCSLSGYVISIADGLWQDPATWNVGRVPSANDVVVVQSTHTVTVSAAAGIKTLYSYGVLRSEAGKPLEIRASGLISNSGQILGADGSTGQGQICGSPGSSIDLRGAPIENAGTIRAGRGGDGARCGGRGGDLMAFGHNTTNTGEILGGDGGNVLGILDGFGGDGGETHVWGKWDGPGFLVNRGLVRGGNGGSGSEAAVGRQSGGNGGRLKLISLPTVDLEGGKQYGGARGLGRAGGANGTEGAVVIEPVVISLAGPTTEVKGGDIVVFGGDAMTLDLSSMGAAALSASGSITLAVGTGSTIDLRGNTQPILHAGDRVVIASDSILLTDGVALEDLVDAGSIEQGGAAVLADLSLFLRGASVGERALPISITLTLLNGAPIADTIQLIPALAKGWQLEGLPPSVTLQAIEGVDLALRLTPPSSAAPGETVPLTVTAVSQHDTNVGATQDIEVRLTSDVYLPMVKR